MLSKLWRRPIQRVCSCSVRRRLAHDDSTPLATVTKRYADPTWASLTCDWDEETPDSMAKFAREAFPSKGVLFTDPLSQFHMRFHSLYYVALKNLRQFDQPSQVLPLLSLWLAHPPPTPAHPREHDPCTQELCRHLMAMSAQLTVTDIVQLLESFRPPHIESIPQALTDYASCWVNVAAPHLAAKDLCALIQAIAGQRDGLQTFWDLACRTLLEAGSNDIALETLASCLFALSKSRVWSEDLMNRSADVMLNADVSWNNPMCHHVAAAYFHLGCLREDLVSTALAKFVPDTDRNEQRCLDMLYFCTLFEIYPERLINAVRAWLNSQSWESENLATLHRLLHLELAWSISQPNLTPLLSDKQLLQCLKDTTLQASSEVSPGSVLRYPHIYDFLTGAVSGNHYVATEVKVFNYSVDMLLVINAKGQLLPLTQHPSTAAMPLIPTLFADRLASILPESHLDLMKWKGLPFRAIAVCVCPEDEFLHRTSRVNGQTALKEKILSGLGYEVLRVRLDSNGRFDRNELSRMLKMLLSVQRPKKPSTSAFMANLSKQLGKWNAK